MNLDDARRIMHEWTTSPALRVHMECVAACMGAYAAVLAPDLAPDDDERWRIAGLLHDFDYERHPSIQEHPAVGVAWLREHADADVDEEILEAILGHNEATNVPRTTPMAHALFAVDELAGFIVACAKVRPNGISDLAPKSVRKKLKDRAFAAAVSRDDIRTGIAELAVDETEHIQRCIDAIRAEAERLEL